MQANTRVECELKYEPGEGFFVRKEQEPERAITIEQLVSLYTEHALLLLQCYPSSWCQIPRPSASEPAA